VNVFARIISYVFHPLLMGTYFFALMIFLLPVALYPINSNSQLLFLVLVFITTFVLPVCLMSFLKILGSIKSFNLESQQERIFPFFMILVLYAVFTYLLTYHNKIGLDDNVLSFC
jgi:uncharacterized membrane protein